MTLGRSWSAILVPEGAEVRLLVGGEGAVLHGVFDALGPAVGDGLGDVVRGGPGGDCLEGCAKGGLVETGGPGGLGGELGHLLDAEGVEVTALAVLLPEEAGVLSAVSAGRHGGCSFVEVRRFSAVHVVG